MMRDVSVSRDRLMRVRKLCVMLTKTQKRTQPAPSSRKHTLYSLTPSIATCGPPTTTPQRTRRFQKSSTTTSYLPLPCISKPLINTIKPVTRDCSHPNQHHPSSSCLKGQATERCSCSNAAPCLSLMQLRSSILNGWSRRFNSGTGQELPTASIAQPGVLPRELDMGEAGLGCREEGVVM